ncbi:two-component system sensor histidine kinase CreC [Lampropedia puyangensis]|uniref:histidine kinase n=1 Tax=Lampropedia puyangensis TaxID=1330072 RepID=A0A4S8ESN6_9BURK|nr:two-component system sensor histidine kinase CreC [Lampropedia puyangensis]THT97466.1 two-component system sensor histidine kinase CreC [Lampropedia puyangensis]
MNFAIRLFVGYFLIVGLAAWFILSFFSREVEPGVRQGTEDALVDSANLLAEIVAPQLAYGALAQGDLLRAISSAKVRQPAASIHGNLKDSIDLRLYITDAKGVVLLDSEFQDVGKDFSRWRDVYLALGGQYGARSTRDIPDDENSSVMYVAAPIVHEGRIVGALSLGKPTRTVLRYANNARQRVRELGLILLVASGAIGLVFTLWLSHSINQLRNYARKVADGEPAQLPTSGGRQLTELARALENMREKLEGKQYVEHYVQSLTHEMKSPLTAIRASAELLPGAPEPDHAAFVQTILEQTQRLQLVIDRLLALARVEQLQQPATSSTVLTQQWVQTVVNSRASRAQGKAIEVRVQVHPQAQTVGIHGDQFLLHQALGNVLDNALDFSPVGSTVTIEVALTQSPAHGTQQTIMVKDEGGGIPDYALAHLFERFYSLPRPETGQKSTGLGLAFVREVMRIHQGEVSMHNRQDQQGAQAQLVLPVTTLAGSQASAAPVAPAV